MSGCIQSQIRLVQLLDAYDSAQRAAEICPWSEAQMDKAEALYDEMFRVAFACGYQPGRDHAHLTTYEYAQMRAETLRRVFPAHLAQANRKAA